MHTKKFNAVFKNGFNPVLGSIPRLPFISYQHIIKYNDIDNIIFNTILFLYIKAKEKTLSFYQFSFGYYNISIQDDTI